MQIKGKVVKVLPATTYGKEGKQKAGLVIVTDDKYPKNVAFTVFGKALESLKGLSPNDEVVVDFNIESREWNDKWFTDAVLFGIKGATSNVTSTAEFRVADTTGGLPF